MWQCEVWLRLSNKLPSSLLVRCNELSTGQRDATGSVCVCFLPTSLSHDKKASLYLLTQWCCRPFRSITYDNQITHAMPDHRRHWSIRYAHRTPVPTAHSLCNHTTVDYVYGRLACAIHHRKSQEFPQFKCCYQTISCSVLCANSLQQRHTYPALVN